MLRRLYTDVEDTLDPDDFIYPCAAPREGPRYQASLPPPRTEDIERGGDSTIEVLSLVRDFSEDDSRRHSLQCLEMTLISIIR